MEYPKLYMILLGCRVKGRHTEQHDIFFGIANSIKSLIPEINKFWPEAKGRLHIDAWREVTYVDGYKISIERNGIGNLTSEDSKLYFLNLGGYKQNEFEEYHYKMVCVGKTLPEVLKKAKETAFYKHTGFKGAPTHIDDKYGIDVDDMCEIKKILPEQMRLDYKIIFEKATDFETDKLHLGYFKLDSFQ